jgi:hypothetical protein
MASDISKKYLVKQAMIILLIPFLILACSITPKEGINLLETSEEMQKEINSSIPIGLPMQKARQIIESNNFTCEDQKNDSFVIDKRDRNGVLLNQTIVEGDFLSCGVEHSYFIASKSWKVFLLYKNDRVIMIYSVVHWQNL